MAEPPPGTAGPSPEVPGEQAGTHPKPLRSASALKKALATVRWHVPLELTVVAAWGLWVGRPYLNLEPTVWPTGREFGTQILTNHFWTELTRCGSCALWNGSMNGGYPALGDVFGSTLHPIVALTTLAFGVVVGAKLTVVFSLIMAGLAQWWIARIMGLGRVARIWVAMMAVVGGHLAGRLETPAIGIIVSTATASLCLAAALQLSKSRSIHAAIWLAVVGATTIVAGQGYVQLSILAWAVPFLFIILDKSLRLRPVWRLYALALGLSILITSVYLVPVTHFIPNFAKAGDPQFAAAQPLEYIPLNLVVSDGEFYRSPLLGKFPLPSLYTLFIGWVPVILAMLSLVLARRKDHVVLLCLVAGATSMILLASAIPLRLGVSVLPVLSGFRHTPLMAGLAVPAILALAAYGLDRLVSLDWPKLSLQPGSQGYNRNLVFGLGWLLAIPLFVGLRQSYEFSSAWIMTADLRHIYENIESLRTPNLAWISGPFGEHFWVEPAVDKGMKVSPVVWAWSWRDQKEPLPEIEVSRGDPPSDTESIGVAEGVPIYLHPDRHYSYISTSGGVIPCAATGSGGELQVRCSSQQPGQLILEENSWTGWYAWRDGERIPLSKDRWLSVDAPAGEHEYFFRYLPWDVPLGFSLSLIGISLAIWLLLRPDKIYPESSGNETGRAEDVTHHGGSPPSRGMVMAEAESMAPEFDAT